MAAPPTLLLLLPFNTKTGLYYNNGLWATAAAAEAAASAAGGKVRRRIMVGGGSQMPPPAAATRESCRGATDCLTDCRVPIPGAEDTGLLSYWHEGSRTDTVAKGNTVIIP